MHIHDCLLQFVAIDLLRRTPSLMLDNELCARQLYNALLIRK